MCGLSGGQRTHQSTHEQGDGPHAAKRNRDKHPVYVQQRDEAARRREDSRADSQQGLRVTRQVRRLLSNPVLQVSVVEWPAAGQAEIQRMVDHFAREPSFRDGAESGPHGFGDDIDDYGQDHHHRQALEPPADAAVHRLVDSQCGQGRRGQTRADGEQAEQGVQREPVPRPPGIGAQERHHFDDPRYRRIGRLTVRVLHSILFSHNFGAFSKSGETVDVRR